MVSLRAPLVLNYKRDLQHGFVCLTLIANRTKLDFKEQAVYSQHLTEQGLS